MKRIKLICQCVILAITPIIITACFQPPYNNFEPYNDQPRRTQKQPYKAYFGSQHKLINTLRKKDDVQFIRYGDTATLVIPTDRYFLFNSPHFNELCYKGLTHIVQLLKTFPCSPIYIAGFTDDVGTRAEKNKLTQARAETMLTYLWANGVSAKQLSAEGYGEKFPVADNHLIHGSAQNRRLEIQWNANAVCYCCKNKPMVYEK